MTPAADRPLRGADLSSVVAVIPVRGLESAKSRLGEPLDPEEREELVRSLLERTVRASLGAGLETMVVSPDAVVLALAEDLGARSLLQGSSGLNEALDEARAALRGATAVLVLPVDLPALDAVEVGRIMAAAAAAAVPGRGLVALVPDRHGSGTNVLLAAPPDVVPFRFGEGSRTRHAAEAQAAGAVYVELDGPLTFDLDTPDDLLLADTAGLDHERGR